MDLGPSFDAKSYVSDFFQKKTDRRFVQPAEKESKPTTAEKESKPIPAKTSAVVKNEVDETKHAPVYATEKPNEPPVKHTVDADDTTARTPYLPFQDHVYWKGLFEKDIAEDGSFRMQYVDSFKRTQVGGIPIPMIENMQDILKKRHVGRRFELYGHSFTITDRNLVLTTRTVYLRYALIMMYRTDDGLHVQYAKQLAEATSDITAPIPNAPHNLVEARDVYLMVLADWLDTKPKQEMVSTDQIPEQTLRAVKALEKAIHVQTEQQALRSKRQDMMQTIVLLDRLGLLKGGLPNDIGDLLRILEGNRHLLHDAEEALTRHIVAEEERTARLLRDGYQSKKEL